MKMKRMKALCRSCHDGYGDEEFCFGRCCGRDMVEVPEELYNRVSHDRSEINKLINTHGKSLLGGN